MIEARHWPAFESLFSIYASWTLRRHFHAVYVRGSLPRTLAPLLVVVQHVAWWDPIVLYYLSRVRFPGKHFAVMDEAVLRKTRFFHWLGGFGLDRANEVLAVDGMRYALAQLKNHGSRVWIFPQGEFAPPERRPLECRPGATWIARRSRAPVVAVALRYEFRDAQFPDAFVSIGEPTLITRELAATPDPVETLLAAEADRLRESVWTRQLDEFEPVVRGRRSISAQYGSE